MRRWRFEFYDYDKSETYQLQYDIDEWKSFGITFGREEKTSVLKSYNSSFTFINQDCEYLKNIVYTRGFSARIALNIYLTDTINGSNSAEELVYECRLELFDCEIRANTFTCPVYVGGFFSLLDSSWNEEYSIENRINSPDWYQNGVMYKGLSLPDNDFEDINFNGGCYSYNKQLAIKADIEVSRGERYAIIENEDRFQFLKKANFLPIIDEKQIDNKLTFFRESSAKIIKDNAQEVTLQQMFVVSSNKKNCGKISISGTLGRVEYTTGQYDSLKENSVFYCRIYLTFMLCIYDNKGEEKWRPSQYSLMAINGVGVTEVREAVINAKCVAKRNENGDLCLVCFDKYQGQEKTQLYFESVAFDTNWLKEDNNGSGGYYLALCLSAEMTYSETQEYIDRGYATSPVNDFNIYDTDIKIDMHYDDFYINADSYVIQAIRPSRLFVKLIEKINQKERLYDKNGIFIGFYAGQYLLDIDVDLLEKEQKGIMLFSSQMARGNLSDISATINTSLSDFIEFCYVVLALKFCCLYDKKTHTYRLFFRKINDCYTDEKIFTIKNIRDFSIGAYSQIIYTQVQVGYNNIEDSILGYEEYNTINTFNTQHQEKQELKKELLCEYTAGCFDVETIIYQMRDNNDANVNSDNIFVLETKKDKTNNNINLLYDINYNNIKKGLNVGISPKRLLILHENELVISCEKLLFVASKRNANFKYNTLLESEDMLLNGRNGLHLPFLIHVSGGSYIDMIHKIEENPFGYIDFEINGLQYQGYIANGTDCIYINPINEKDSNFLLIAKVIPF